MGNNLSEERRLCATKAYLGRKEFFHHPEYDEVSQEETLVQSLMTDPNNPRMLRFIREGIDNREADSRVILAYGNKYGLRPALDKALSQRSE